MMVPQATAAGIRDGRITLAFRRWQAPRVKVGGTQLTSAGIIRFDACEPVDPDDLTEADARAAGLPDLATLRARLDPGGAPRPRGPRGGKGGDTVYRVTVSFVGADPRLELRERVPRGRDLAGLVEAVDRLDRGKRTGPWTYRILSWIEQHPGELAADLAAELDRELLGMKADIRKLKALGLTISLPKGYQLSARGKGYLAARRRREARLRPGEA
ncbi:hypothetical protein ACQBAU_12385 [Propionibacteriaceae bacterium Y2011]|uniref:hypothetical protein n=1 Tax=Microlunatus sp. Y2014 TaxID=3418488 RepID=UPI003B469EC4